MSSTARVAQRPVARDRERAGGPVTSSLRSHSLPALPAVVLGLVALAVVTGPVLTSSPVAIDLAHALEPPSLAHPLGTDESGRDALARLLAGGRVSLGVGASGALLALVLGAALGAWAGYHGGWADALAMRVVDGALAFPSILTILLFIAILRSGVPQLILLIGLTGWMPAARLVRGVVREVKARPFVEAARALGAPGGRLVVRHLLPNLAGIIWVAGLAELNRAILAEATISFLGLGVSPPTPSWGNLLIGAQDYLWQAPWLAIGPGFALTLTQLAVYHLSTVEG